MPRVTYFLEGRYLGRADFPPQPFPWHSTAFFCMTCGEIWGRVVVDEGYWEVIQRACRLHTPRTLLDWGGTPGSLLHGQITQAFIPVTHRANCLENLPPEVLRHELLLSLERYQNECTCDE